MPSNEFILMGTGNTIWRKKGSGRTYPEKNLSLFKIIDLQEPAVQDTKIPLVGFLLPEDSGRKHRSPCLDWVLGRVFTGVSGLEILD